MSIEMSVFLEFMHSPTPCAITNSKLLLLCGGVDIDFAGIAELYPDLGLHYKTSKSVVSFRHLDVPAEYRALMIDELLLSDGRRTSIVKTYISRSAPVVLYCANGRLQLRAKKSGVVVPVSVDLVELDDFSRADPEFPDKNVFLNRIGVDRVGLLPFDGCSLWMNGMQCAFCGSAPRKTAPGGLPNALDAHRQYGGDYRSWWGDQKDSALRTIRRSAARLVEAPLKPHCHFMYMSENLPDYDYMYEIAIELSAAVNEIIPLSGVDSYFNAMPPASERYLGLIRDAGYRSFMTNMEFLRREDFEAFCPGKHAAYPDGYGHMMNMLTSAVEVFGAGNVRTNFVLTDEQVPHLKDGVQTLAREGIVSDVSVFFPRKASRWRNRSAPTIDTILDFSLFLARVYHEYEFRPYCCRVSSRSSIMNELSCLLQE